MNEEIIGYRLVVKFGITTWQEAAVIIAVLAAGYFSLRLRKEATR